MRLKSVSHCHCTLHTKWKKKCLDAPTRAPPLPPSLFPTFTDTTATGLLLPLLRSVAVLRGGHGATPPCQSSVPPEPPLPCKIGCELARLHSTCIYSLASRSWCQMTPLTQSCIMSSGILGPQIRMWPPRWPPQTAAARNAPDYDRQTVSG